MELLKQALATLWAPWQRVVDGDTPPDSLSSDRCWAPGDFKFVRHRGMHSSGLLNEYLLPIKFKANATPHSDDDALMVEIHGLINRIPFNEQNWPANVLQVSATPVDVLRSSDSQLSRDNSGAIVLSLNLTVLLVE